MCLALCIGRLIKEIKQSESLMHFRTRSTMLDVLR